MDKFVRVKINKFKERFQKYFLRLSTREQIIFAKRLAILIKADIPILASLDMLARQTDSKNGKQIISHLRDCVNDGQSLAAALKCHRQIFGSFAVNVVQIGEISGTLAQNLNYWADDLKKKEELKRSITGALVYPVFIVFAVIGIVILLVGYVFPKIQPIFQSFKTQLPWSTRALIAISDWAQHYGIYFLAAIFVAAVVFIFLAKKPAIKLALDEKILRIPLLGRLLRNYYIANFSRSLGLMLKSDIEIVKTFRIVADTIPNLNYRRNFYEIAAGVDRGESISKLMEENIFLFPPIVTQMVAVGEATGNLSSSLLYISEIHEEEMNSAAKTLSVSIEPILMVFMGLLVGFIAVAIITPIYGITQNLRS